MTYELKHIRGIPYYLHGTTVHTFELDAGQPSSNCIPFGTYHPATDSIVYYDNWEQLLQPRLDAFRIAINSQDRGSRDASEKPQKPRKATRTPRKAGSSSAKSVACEPVWFGCIVSGGEGVSWDFLEKSLQKSQDKLEKSAQKT